MKSVGIICEYNPFHNGHLYHINKVKEMFPEHIIILVMSGNFTQRGDVSLISKWDKTEIALNYVDLVVELPFAYSTQSADIFAKGSIEILKNLNVDAVVFGSECNDIEKLKMIATVQESKEFDNLVKKYLDEGINYPTALSKAIKKISKIKIDSPNDLLGISYIKALKNTNIKPITIKRTNDFHSKKLNKISSASAIREAIKNNKDISNYVPKVSLKYLKNVTFTEDFYSLLKYKIISSDIKEYLDVDEGIENRINKYIYSCNSLDELILKIKSKRFTYSKLKRMFIHILCGFTKKQAKNLKTEYIRVLGFNSKGRKYLKTIKNSNVPIITTYKSNFEILQLENKVSIIYNNDLDYKHKPIIK